MEIGISKDGDVSVMTLKGRLRAQHWRVIDKHVDALLDRGARRIVMDLSGVTFMDASGFASIRDHVRKAGNRDAGFMVLADSDYLREAFRSAEGGSAWDGLLYLERGALEKRLRDPRTAATAPGRE